MDLQQPELSQCMSEQERKDRRNHFVSCSDLKHGKQG